MSTQVFTRFVFLISLLALSACGQSDQSQSENTNTSTVQNADTQANAVASTTEQDERPNILIIMTDDMGYTDLGVYGGEVNTPNLDQLARDGIILTDFHNQAVCAPTRAALMAGTDNHNAGGAMHQAGNQRDEPGYESYLNEDVVAFPATLQAAGYNTYFAGKWHLGGEAHQNPAARGFDRSFALIQGMASHYHDAYFVSTERISDYTEDGQKVEKLPEDFFSTTFYTDYVIDAIDKDEDTGKPWFTYMALTAPHWPLQAPDEYIAKYKGMYDDGYEVLREKRIAGAKAAGIFPEDAQAYQKLDIVAPWDSLSEDEKKYSAKEMEIYAAMIDHMDVELGRLIDHLKANGDYENTLIMFFSDNGAEGQEREPAGGEDSGFDLSYENMGKINSYVRYGVEWTGALGGVFRYFKSFSSEGGSRAPSIIHYPKSDHKGVISGAFTSVVDVAATAIDLANTTHPTTGTNGQPLKPLTGESLVPLIMGEVESVRPDDFVFGWEVFGHLAVRKGDYKLLWLSSKPSDTRQRPAQEADKWMLFDVTKDPGEVNDLAAAMPEKVAELKVAFDQYSAEHGLIIPIVEDTPAGGGMGGGMGAGMGAGGMGAGAMGAGGMGAGMAPPEAE